MSQTNDHQMGSTRPPLDAQRTDTHHVPTETNQHSLSQGAAATFTPELLRRDPKLFAKAAEIANNNRDAKLLSRLYDIAKDKLLKQCARESLSYLRAQAILARTDMLKHANSLMEAYKQHRVIPLPHDAPNRLAGLPDGVITAEQEHSKARDWSLIRDRIAADRFKAAGVVESQVVPDLDRQQIAQLREFANTLPELSMFRKEFTEAAKIAEQDLIQRESAQTAAREAQVTRTHTPAARDKEASAASLVQTRDRDR
jgi:hypothetical protein